MSARDRFVATARQLRGDASPLVLYRALTVAALAVSLYVTWGLWGPRSDPPMLPLVSLPALDLRWPMIAALVLVLVRPLTGTVAFGVLLLHEIAVDQTRIQPEFLSLTLLLVGTLPGKGPRFLAVSHLVSMWGWAGFNKLVSPEFIATGAPAMIRAIWADAPAWILASGGYAFAATEVITALLALHARTRRLCAITALGLHGWICCVLAFQPEPNAVVWPWNLVLAVSGFAFIAGSPETLSATVRPLGGFARVAAIILLVSPAGFYVGRIDAYLSHNLYSLNTPLASAAPPVLKFFRVPFPPAVRLYEQHFQLTCKPGEYLDVLERRPFLQPGTHHREIACEAHPLAGARR